MHLIDEQLYRAQLPIFALQFKGHKLCGIRSTVPVTMPAREAVNRSVSISTISRHYVPNLPLSGNSKWNGTEGFVLFN